MKIGSSTGTFLWFCSVEEAIKEIARIGYDGVEIWADRPHAWPRDYQKAKREMLKELVSSCDIEVPSICPIFFDLNFASANPAVRELTVKQTKEAIEMASDIGSEVVLVDPGKLQPLNLPEKAWDFAVEGLRRCAKYAEDNGVFLGVENILQSYLATTPDKMVKMITDIGSEYVGAYLDVANGNPLDSPINYIKKLGNSILSVHVSDNDGKSTLHLPVGRGKIDFKAMVEALKSIGYDRYLIAEVFPDPEVCPDPYAGVRETKEKLERLI